MTEVKCNSNLLTKVDFYLCITKYIYELFMQNVYAHGIFKNSLTQGVLQNAEVGWCEPLNVQALYCCDF